MTLILPLVAEPPELLGTIVYTPGEPTVKLPVCDFAMPRVAGAGWMVVGSLAVAELVELPPDAVAVLVTLPDAVAVTLMSITAPTDCAAIATADVQVMLCPAWVQVQPVPVPELYVSPAGSVSTIVIVPTVGPSPVLATESE